MWASFKPVSSRQMPELPAAVTVSLPLKSLAATGALAAWVAARARVRDVIALHGGLGAGKTEFARAFIHARPGGQKFDEVPSPTFTLVQVYDLSPPIWHFDLYRLTRPEEAWELGLEEAFSDAISLIEWPERLGSLLPEARLDIELALGTTAEARTAALTGHGEWAQRLTGVAPADG
jgi:tRNA threonylcarbamoyladenosine biosynthesis protein TsaE